jgi:AraC-like DNA-binding protein
LSAAARLLERRVVLETIQPISAIAYTSGFGDYTYFARQFRSRFGHPPGPTPSVATSISKEGAHANYQASGDLVRATIVRTSLKNSRNPSTPPRLNGVSCELVKKIAESLSVVE